MTSSVPLSFVLLSEHAYPDPAEVIENAGRLGIGLAHEMGEADAVTFRIDGGGTLIIGHIAAPHPDAASMPVGPTSPDPAVVSDHVGHYIVTALGLPETPLPSEVVMGIVTAAIIQASPAVAAMLGHGAIFHRADVFAAAVEAAGPEVATMITVDITAAQEGPNRVSFLTHGLERYDREEFWVSASVAGKGALDYLMALVRWMVVDPSQVLPTGDTVGRTPDEQIVVQRVPSPIDGKPDVIRLDMDIDSIPGAGPAQPPNKKRRWFGRT